MHMDDNVGGGQGSSTVAGEVGCAIGGGDFNGGWWDGLCDRRTRTWALGQETAAAAAAVRATLQLYEAFWRSTGSKTAQLYAEAQDDYQ